MACGHLVSGLEHKETDCHFENGNNSCPASEMSIVVGIPVEQIADNIVTYEKLGQFDKVLALQDKLSKYSEIQRIQVAKLVHKKRQEQPNDKA